MSHVSKKDYKKPIKNNYIKLSLKDSICKNPPMRSQLPRGPKTFLTVLLLTRLETFLESSLLILLLQTLKDNDPKISL